MLSIAKKPEMTAARTTMLRLGSVVAALIVSGAVIACLGINPFEALTKIIEGSVMTSFRITETISKAIPLVVISLGISVAFTMKFWNIGAEGQFYMGAFGAAFVALTFPSLPSYILLPLMMLAGVICGGLWALIPAVLKVRLGTSETLVTLMLNYVAILWIGFLQLGPMKDPNAYGFAKIARFSENATLPELFGVHIGWIIALVLTVFIYFLLSHTKLGYEIAVMGENRNTAQYAGMNLTKVLLIAVIISGGLCGLAGMMQASAIERSLSDQMSGGIGFTAIITAWIARLKPFPIIIVSVLFAMLLQGSAFLQTSLQIPSALADIIQGVILFFILSTELFTRYKIVRTGKRKEV